VKTYGTLRLVEGEWRVRAEPQVILRMKRVFARAAQERSGEVRLRDTLETCRELEWFLARVPLDVDPRDHLAHRAAEHARRQEVIAQVLAPTYTPPAFDLAVPARTYQRVAADLLLRNGSLLLADDVGLGKTASAICALTDPRALPAVVVTLTHLPRQWKAEIAKFAPALRVAIPKTGKPEDLTRGPRGKAQPFPDVVVLNYHKLAGWADTLAAAGIKTVIFDEAQELRTGSGQKGLAAARLATAAAFRIGLSATPIYNYGGELWNVLDVLAPDALGTHEEFVREWCVHEVKPRIKDPAAFGTYLRDAGLMLRRTRAEVGRELPPLTKIAHEVDADTEALDRVGDAAAELARVILAQGGTARGEKLRASEELSWMLRQATGIAKAPFVAAFVRLLVESGERVVLFGWHRECFAKGTLVLMHDGTTKPVEQVAVGDVVMGPDSRPRHVSSLTRGEGPLYRVRPNKGEPWTCSANHILALHRSERNCTPFVKMTARQFASLSPRSQRGYSLYRAEAVEFPSASEVVEPWLVGYWLGDGVSRLEQGLRISTADPEVVDAAAGIAAAYGLRLHRNECKRGATPCSFYHFASSRSGRWGRNELLNRFRALGLDRNKRIPQSYKTASIEARRQLLAGLLDSDGHVYHGTGAGSADITSKYPLLAEDIAFVCRSLGLAAYVYPCHRTDSNGVTRAYYRVSISGDLTAIPTKIARKRPPVRRQRKNVLRTGFAIEPAGDGEYYGFEVDGDHLFLLADFTVVHNCYSIWQDRLANLSPALYTGSESPAQKDEARRRFVEGETPVLIMSLRSGAGLDGLQGCARTVVFGELDWSPGVHEQCVGRVHRDGQGDPVVAYYLHADSGSDPVVLDVLGVKRQQIEGLRDPQGALLEQLDAGEGNIRKLAEALLRQRGAKIEAAG
jgi:superfamily II DNA or RNA helicase